MVGFSYYLELKQLADRCPEKSIDRLWDRYGYPNYSHWSQWKSNGSAKASSLLESPSSMLWLGFRWPWLIPSFLGRRNYLKILVPGAKQP